MEEFILVIFVVIFITTFIVAFLKKNSANAYKDYVQMENIPEDFKKIYNELYEKNAMPLQELRKSVLTKYVIFGVCMAILLIVVFPNIYMIDESLIEVFFVIFFAIIVVFLGLMQKYMKRYTKTYKHNIISKFVKLVNENLEYKNEGRTARPEYMIANFDNRPFNRFYQDDYIEGDIEENANMKIFDIHIQNVVKSGKHTHTEEIFQGIFARCTSLNNINTTIKVSRNKLKILDSKDRIQMDSGEFEEYFDVYAQDKITAMRILTSDVMECLLDFQNKYSLDFEIVFKNNIIYLRFFTGPMFEPKLTGDAMDEGLIFRYYTILKFIIELTQSVNSAKKDLDI